MTGNKTEIALRIEVRCMLNEAHDDNLQSPLMQLDSDMEGASEAVYKCPYCQNQVKMEFIL